MKKLFIALLSALLLASCSDSAESPVIEVTGCFVNDDSKDYSSEINSLPSLKQGDEVTILLRLDGHGEDLNTFLVKEDLLTSNFQFVAIDFEEVPIEVLSGDKEFNDVENGKLGFVDGLKQLDVKLKAKVEKVREDGLFLYFYLFSKAVDSEGAKVELKLNMIAP